MPGIFIKSAPSVEESPEHQFSEVAFVGRSNAGKSALINAIAKTKNLARVSQKPGKTELLNFYKIDGNFVLVDTPGYGYAARGQEARRSWTPMIEGFLKKRESLKGVVLVVDSQRSWTDDEENLLDWLTVQGLPVVLVLTKADRLNQKMRAHSLKEFHGVSGLAAIELVSASKNKGIDQLMRTVFEKILST